MRVSKSGRGRSAQLSRKQPPPPKKYLVLSYWKYAEHSYNILVYQVYDESIFPEFYMSYR